MNDREDRCSELFQKKGNEKKCEWSTIPTVLVGQVNKADGGRR